MSSRFCYELEQPPTLHVGETIEFLDLSSNRLRRAVITSLGTQYASIRVETDEARLPVTDKPGRLAS